MFKFKRREHIIYQEHMEDTEVLLLLNSEVVL